MRGSQLGLFAVDAVALARAGLRLVVEYLFGQGEGLGVLAWAANPFASLAWVCTVGKFPGEEGADFVQRHAGACQCAVLGAGLKSYHNRLRYLGRNVCVREARYLGA